MKKYLSSPGKRIRGRKGQVLRKRRLFDHPLCEDCLLEDKTRPTEILDHVTPLAQGGQDVDSNIRGLCKRHDEIRTAEQFGFRKPRTYDPVTGWPIEE